MSMAKAAHRALVTALIVAAVNGGATAALADAPHGDGGHVHSVQTGSGGCTDINSVAFLPEDRGLHRGANSSGADRGVWHGACP